MIPRHLIIGVAAMLAVALGMSLYAWRMRGRATQAESPAEYAHPVAAPVQGPTEQVTLYVAYDDPGRAAGAGGQHSAAGWTPGTGAGTAASAARPVYGQGFVPPSGPGERSARCVSGGSRAGGD